MSKVRYTTNIEDDLLQKAKEQSSEYGLKGANEVIEKALKFYFANSLVEVWEKPLKDGFVKKIVVRPGKVTAENVRSRKVYTDFDEAYYTNELLEKRGYKRVWKLRKEVCHI